jgi:hypothetical protein
VAWCQPTLDEVTSSVFSAKLRNYSIPPGVSLPLPLLLLALVQPLASKVRLAPALYAIGCTSGGRISAPSSLEGLCVGGFARR